MSPILRRALLALVAVVLACACSRGGGDAKLRLATTTSVVDSGLLAAILPAFERRSGLRVEVSAVGSGKAIGALATGAADVALTHAPEDEQAALAAGAIARRVPVMHNDFVLVGPRSELAVVAGTSDFRDALRRIAASGKKFVSRADGSGTHLREMSLWQAAGVAPDAFRVAASAGMGETLALASELGAFTLSDRSTFVARRGDLDLAIVFQGDDELRNAYSALEPVPGAAANAAGARALVEFLRSAEGRALIGGHGVASAGEPLFTPAD